ncbi:MAG: hypothetical protein D6773_03255 [Alphaproteobacteria bacterium]|nr:MAG: hypothetical protein D6773_03255 [Alphaproteobacteria bacterium]
MKLTLRTEEDLQAELHREFVAGQKAVSLAMDRVGSTLQRNWRGQITGAGLGRRLANTIRAKRYPEGQDSMDAAALVWSKAPEIIGAHEEGAVIRSKDGFWLAIPIDASAKRMRGPRNAKVTPHIWEERTGRRLRFVYRRGRHPLLVDDGTARERRTADPLRFTASRRRFRRNVVIPIFVLVPQVKLPKRLALAPAAEAVARTTPAEIVRAWRSVR